MTFIYALYALSSLVKNAMYYQDYYHSHVLGKHAKRINYPTYSAAKDFHYSCFSMCLSKCMVFSCIDTLFKGKFFHEKDEIFSIGIDHPHVSLYYILMERLILKFDSKWCSIYRMFLIESWDFYQSLSQVYVLMTR